MRAEFRDTTNTTNQRYSRRVVEMDERDGGEPEECGTDEKSDSYHINFTIELAFDVTLRLLVCVCFANTKGLGIIAETDATVVIVFEHKSDSIFAYSDRNRRSLCVRFQCNSNLLMYF